MKEYIITCSREQLDFVYKQLEQYKPLRFSLLSGLAIKLHEEQAQSLLEKLASIEGIQYREAKLYKALDDDKL